MIRTAKAMGVWARVEIEAASLVDLARIADRQPLHGRELKTYRSLILRFRRVIDGPSSTASQAQTAQEELHEALYHDATRLRCPEEDKANSYLHCPAFG